MANRHELTAERANGRKLLVRTVTPTRPRRNEHAGAATPYADRLGGLNRAPRELGELQKLQILPLGQRVRLRRSLGGPSDPGCGLDVCGRVERDLGIVLGCKDGQR